jgi:hypothetical protein
MWVIRAVLKEEIDFFSLTLYLSVYPGKLFHKVRPQTYKGFLAIVCVWGVRVKNS